MNVRESHSFLQLAQNSIASLWYLQSNLSSTKSPWCLTTVKNSGSSLQYCCLELYLQPLILLLLLHISYQSRQSSEYIYQGFWLSGHHHFLLISELFYQIKMEGKNTYGSYCLQKTLLYPLRFFRRYVLFCHSYKQQYLDSLKNVNSVRTLQTLFSCSNSSLI